MGDLEAAKGDDAKAIEEYRAAIAVESRRRRISITAWAICFGRI